MQRLCLSLLALSILGSSAVYAASAPDLDSTALSITLLEAPLIDLSAPSTQATIAARKADLNAIFDTYLTDAGKSSFYQPTPMVLGEILIKFDDATTAKIDALFAGQTSLVISNAGIGVPDVDALFAADHITSIEKPFSFAYLLKFPATLNPNLVAKDFSALAAVDYAEVNGLMNFGGYEVARLGSVPNVSVYALTVGWGDCPSGCIAHHRFYFEVGFVNGQVKATRIGDSGEPMADDDELLGPLFR